ncbi:hypothetical protein PHYBLDRAFT_168454 [Phycomyces blakesleeanus NRRL 1555(-)]|uniref:Uncharacterized protein n=1 Tax=Phycomyces blakesleeanus (strain ATCC 8743b / DSM 1359 / FGSC 10004 / NBRC 33097 / NRRL 1555) TaxID=763407 RepID=A0A162PUA0_PHYB8|nr:hypothetical protein PHYBLDRAFT_168454 [Phycomyces blakesleeanus NRRL 1555(-)]OAD74046.1 hypothetical protein PHYBLDRAFT_168454 [Phycomyces blakesleeanus NRRL 1555(-)]|eukprot:XP_018292086.1 hypothetical protein PHYBLDRAFT_168454 [Phycomyces blakesleeanus NRRL 1555(-)]
MSCLNWDGLNDFQFAPLILSVSQDFSGPLTKTYTLGGFTKCHWSLSRSSFFDYTPTLILYRQTNNISIFRMLHLLLQCHCILCLSTLLFSELSDIHLFSCLTLFKQTGQEGVPQQAMEYSRGRLHQGWTNGCSKGIT